MNQVDTLIEDYTNKSLSSILVFSPLNLVAPKYADVQYPYYPLIYTHLNIIRNHKRKKQKRMPFLSR